MLQLILIAQISTSASQLQKLPAATINTHLPAANAQQEQLRRRAIAQELRQLNQHARETEQDRQKIFDSLPPSRVDCDPLFPPVSGYPPGISSIACH